jgi:hypothetical protein
MKTFRMLLLALVVAGVGAAASWDGTHGDFSVVTKTPTGQTVGASGLPGDASRYTEIHIATTNRQITAVRVMVSWVDSGGFTGRTTITVDLGLLGANILFHVPESSITAPPTITGLIDGPTEQL